MPQPTTAIPGLALGSLVLAAIVAYVSARVLLRQYTASIGSEMDDDADPPATASGTPALPGASAYAGSPQQLRRALQISPWRAAAVQALAALVVAGVLATLLASSLGTGAAPAPLAALMLTALWPGALAVMMVAGLTRRQRLMILAVGAAVYTAFGLAAMGSASASSIGALARMWLIVNLLPTVYLIPFFTRRMRAAGPLLLLISSFLTMGIVLAGPISDLAPAQVMRLVAVLGDRGVPAGVVVLGTFVLGGAIGLALGLGAMGLVTRAYLHYRTGDDGIALAALWLVFVTFACTFHLAFGGVTNLLLGMGTFPLYLLVVWVGHRFRGARPDHGSPALLLLRVFARKGATETLLHDVGRHWRHVGPIRMIAGWDLASTSIGPDEIVKYWLGRTADLFVRNPADAVRALSRQTARREPDGRFRIHKSFCGKHAWQPVAERLIETSSVIVADLRELGDDPDKHQGMRYELETLVTTGAIARTVILRDHSPVVADVLAGLGVDLSAVSMLSPTGDTDRDTSLLLDHLAARCLRSV